MPAFYDVGGTSNDAKEWICSDDDVSHGGVRACGVIRIETTYTSYAYLGMLTIVIALIILLFFLHLVFSAGPILGLFILLLVTIAFIVFGRKALSEQRRKEASPEYQPSDD